jgi:hypothetical protein
VLAPLVFALSGCGGGGGSSGQPSKRCPQLMHTAREIDHPKISGVGASPDEVYRACADADGAVARVRDVWATKKLMPSLFVNGMSLRVTLSLGTADRKKNVLTS